MKSKRDERDESRATATKVHDDVWGDSLEGPVRGEGTPEPGGTWVRDERRDPWSGRPVQNVGELPSAGPTRGIPVDPEAEGPPEEQAGIVGRDERLKGRSTD
jgi:hypothetical protein